MQTPYRVRLQFGQPRGEKDMFRTVLAILLLGTVVSACNTMAGFGRDVERVGDKIEQKAERNK
jgi:entericidin A